ncbi:MAG: hypothetical protein HY568_04515 [Candidatus Latescibacteria bacterium]|nr:hypothetical protein [Candidatus Latescibacterota bacterium]
MTGHEANRPSSDEELSWTVWPARDRPLAAGVILASAAVLGVLIAKSTGDSVLGFAAPVFILASLGSFLAKTEYRLTRETIGVRTLGVSRERPWSEMRRATVDRTGVFLSPFRMRHWLEGYRGLRLLFGGNRDQVVAFVEARLGITLAGAGDPRPGGGSPGGGRRAAGANTGG